MQIDILTPAFQQPGYLERCIASVEQQQAEAGNFTFTHHIQNGGGDDETRAVLEAKATSGSDAYRLSYVHEQDSGMYDALNRAFATTSGDIVGHLNCDEQYLPGTLAYVAERFQADPGLQVLSGAVVVTRPDGSYRCSRLPVPPSISHTLTCHLALLTAATFYRRSLIESLGTYFDTRYRTAGDADLFVRILRSGTRIRVCKQYFALYAVTGENLAMSEEARKEQDLLRQQVPVLLRAGRPVLGLLHRLKKWRHGCYRLHPFEYSYLDNTLTPVQVRVPTPRGQWQD